MTINLNFKKRSCNTTPTLLKVGGLLFLALQTWLVLSWKRVTGFNKGEKFTLNRGRS